MFFFGETLDFEELVRLNQFLEATQDNDFWRMSFVELNTVAEYIFIGGSSRLERLALGFVSRGNSTQQKFVWYLNKTVISELPSLSDAIQIALERFMVQEEWVLDDFRLVDSAFRVFANEFSSAATIYFWRRDLIRNYLAQLRETYHINEEDAVEWYRRFLDYSFRQRNFNPATVLPDSRNKEDAYNLYLIRKDLLTRYGLRGVFDSSTGKTTWFIYPHDVENIPVYVFRTINLPQPRKIDGSHHKTDKQLLMEAIENSLERRAQM